MSSSDQPPHRMLRVLEYIGSEEFIRDAIECRAVKGEVRTKKGRIREAILGETSELLQSQDKDAENV